MEQQSLMNVLVIWRDKQLDVGVSLDAKVGDLGKKLQELTHVKPDTMRFLVPTKKSSKMISPFSDEHSSLSLQEMSMLEGKPIRMMGVFDAEIEEVSHNNMKSDLRVAGFEEEEKRSRQRVLNRPQTPLKLPTGTYIFCDFRTLNIPGVELNPPASEALRRMHMLACDPGIIAIMNKHKWQVGVMTEMAPIGYVGISPKCLLGYNKNHGEEISLRVRTDDLKGFRKYESIKKTLLHELAHMVYSEHDANFFALNKQLDQEAASLDWTKSRSHTLSGHRRITGDYCEEDVYLGANNNYNGQKLGGTSDPLATVRASSVAAAYHRFLNNELKSKIPDEPNCKIRDDEKKINAEPDPDDTLVIEKDDTDVDDIMDPSSMLKVAVEPDLDDYLNEDIMSEPDPDDSHTRKVMASINEPDPDDLEDGDARKFAFEPDPDDSISSKINFHSQGTMKPALNPSENAENGQDALEPDPDDSGSARILKDEAQVRYGTPNYSEEPDPDECATEVIMEAANRMELDSDRSQAVDLVKTEPDPDNHVHGLDNEDMRRIQEPVATICARLQGAIERLKTEITPGEATSVLQTLFKIIRNVIEHPDEMKFRRLRMANPQFQRNVANYKAAMEVLTVIGFSEDVVSDQVGGMESYVVLKRNDPGLLWLAKSSLEVSMA